MTGPAPCIGCDTAQGLTERITCRVCGLLLPGVSTHRFAQALRTMADAWAFDLDGSGYARHRAFVLVLASELLRDPGARPARWHDKALCVWHQLHGLERARCIRARAYASHRAVLLETRVRLRSWYPEVFGIVGQGLGRGEVGT